MPVADNDFDHSFVSQYFLEYRCTVSMRRYQYYVMLLQMLPNTRIISCAVLFVPGMHSLASCFSCFSCFSTMDAFYTTVDGPERKVETRNK
jgi:hypothetical protein